MQEKQSIYRTPDSILDSGFESETRALEPASRWLRLANYIIDSIGYVVFAFIVGIVTALVFGDPGLALLESVPDFFLGLFIVLLYYILWEGSMARTPGKMITGTRVVDENGRKPRIGQVIGRTVCRLIPFEFVSFFFNEGRGWHDSIPKTFVVKTR